MSALGRAAEHARALKRELEAAASVVPAYDVATTRFLAAEVSDLRRRVEGIQRAIGELSADPEPPAGA